jgi:dipeptidase D
MSGVYHEWKYQKHSMLRNRMESLYEEMYGKKPVVRIMHGGVECGVFSEQIKGFDAVSIGPDIKDVHTVNERMSVSSAARVYEYLLKLLAELK